MSTYANVKMIATGLIEQAREQAGGQLTLGVIEEKVNASIAFTPGAAEGVNAEQLIADFERDYHTHVGEPLTLQNDEDGWEPWVNKARGDIEWRFWERYRTYLLLNQGFPKTVVDALDDTTDETLNNLRDPSYSGVWDRRGMVVGHVQAGKTTNYAGLICKAADAGYKVIIVLTGFHNNLRTQTQIRLEESFVGYDITASQEQSSKVAVGVGNISSDKNLLVDTITNRSEKGDFNRMVANSFSMNPGGKPLVFVLKKNASVLKNLTKYLEHVSNDKDENDNPHISGVPLLLIDDEADQGSVDTKKIEMSEEGDPDPDHDPARINGLIRKVLFIFSQSAYVGYTATPFANIFSHSGVKSEKVGEDLFPRSFITVMPTPSNYIGPDTVFGLVGDDGENRDPGLPIVRPIDDYAASIDLSEKTGWMPPKHNRNHRPLHKETGNVPPSMREAVMFFIIACSVRALRGQKSKHNSMLIHVTRFVDVQERVYKQVRELMRELQDILAYGEEGSREELLGEIHTLWQDDFVKANKTIADPLCPEHKWADVGERVLSSAKSISVRRINGTAGDVLDYQKHQKNGLNVIAIGGDKLSRGLTLEGLTVSYFTRPSRMYDTLMQMGRWFGYRDGFIDVCRLYAPQGLIDWFEHITDASEELRKEFLLMCEMGETPANYGQRVQSHPVLMVTSQVKMRHTAELKLSYQGAISETIVFARDKSIVEANFIAADSFIRTIAKYASMQQWPVRKDAASFAEGKYLWRGVKPDDVLEFLKNYNTPAHAIRVNTALLAEYIQKQIDNDDLSNWSVLIAGKASDSANEIKLGGYTTGGLTRSNHPAYSEQPKDVPKVYRIRRLVSPTDELWDLNDTQFDAALALHGDVDRKTPGGPEIRVSRDSSQALLILYPLEARNFTGPLDTDKPYVGFALSFPGIKKDKPVTYRVNEVYQGQMDE